MICIPAELEVDDESIIAQMDRVEKAQWAFEDEMNKLRRLIMGTRVKEKRDSEESLKN